jgi:hypothetical protein
MTTPARIAVVTWLLMPLALAAQQPPEVPRLAEPIPTGLHVDKRSPDERTLAERIAHLDATLVVRVVGARRGIATGIPIETFGPLVNLPNFDPPPMIHSEYTVEVVEVLKPGSRTAVPGAHTSIAVSGGEALWKGRRMIAPETSPTLLVGDIYVVMLSVARPDSVPFAEDVDIFHLSGGRFVAHAAAQKLPYTRTVLNRPWPAALAAFRAAASRASLR